jgi:hypothetical protein
MKVLLDSCVWGGAAAELRAAGHDVVWTGEWPADPGDEDILEFAHTEAPCWSRWTRTSAKWPSCTTPRIVGFCGS